MSSAIEQRAEALATRLRALGYEVAAQEMRDSYGLDDEWASIVIDDLLDAEYLTDY